MHEAMKEPRTTIARLPTGRLAWGAYQHYGNPYFKLLPKSPVDSAAVQRISNGKNAAVEIGRRKNRGATPTGQGKRGWRGKKR